VSFAFDFTERLRTIDFVEGFASYLGGIASRRLVYRSPEEAPMVDRDAVQRTPVNQEPRTGQPHPRRWPSKRRGLCEAM
jgi:hypothetical protein